MSKSTVPEAGSLRPGRSSSSPIPTRLPPLDPGAAEELIEALGAETGMVAAVGAGGKKTTLNRLAEAHIGLGTPRLAMIAAVQMGPPPDELGLDPLIAAPDAIGSMLGAAADLGRIVLAAPPTKPGRLGGLPAELIPRLHASGRFVVSLIKADGARMRGIKAPAPEEPVLPEGVTTVLPVISTGVLGRPLESSVAHRPERLASLLGVAPGQTLAAEHLVQLLISPKGVLQGVGDARVIPVLNAVDDPSRVQIARRIAEMALARTDRIERVVLASMISSRPVVEVVGRSIGSR